MLIYVTLDIFIIHSGDNENENAYGPRVRNVFIYFYEELNVSLDFKRHFSCTLFKVVKY